MSRTFSRLLLATEHSEFDAGSEHVALAIAGHSGLPLVALLPILSNPEYEAVTPQRVARVEAAAAGRLAEMATAAGEAGVTWEAVVRRGPELFREIVDEARERGTDLLVIRRRARVGWLAKLLLGETVGHVLANAPCSVLVVPKQARLWSRHVMVVVDPAAPDALAIGQGAALAAESALPLTLVSVIDDTPYDNAQRALAQSLMQVHRIVPTARSELLHGNAHQQLSEAAKRLGADLIVVGGHIRGRFARAWNGGTVQKIIGLADSAVLVSIGGSPTSHATA